VVKEHGGRIDISSELKKGTAFTIYVPRKQAAQEKKIFVC